MVAIVWNLVLFVLVGEFVVHGCPKKRVFSLQYVLLFGHKTGNVNVNIPVILCILETPERVLMQTVKTRMKCNIMLHSSGSTPFAKIKTIFIDRNNS